MKAWRASEHSAFRNKRLTRNTGRERAAPDIHTIIIIICASTNTTQLQDICISVIIRLIIWRSHMSGYSSLMLLIHIKSPPRHRATCEYCVCLVPWCVCVCVCVFCIANRLLVYPHNYSTVIHKCLLVVWGLGRCTGRFG